MDERLDPITIENLISKNVEHATCAECCKYYVAPDTATCGHSHCHGCWRGRRKCYNCTAPINRKALKSNIPLQKLTEHVQALSDAFKKLFNVQLDDYTLGAPVEPQTSDPIRNVKEWLASSQNHFSGPVLSSQKSNCEIIVPAELSKSKIQIHTHSMKKDSSTKIVAKPPIQEDWDKIEVLPDTEEILKSEEHVVGPMDFENFIIDDNEYTAGNPRRSSRKRELNADSNQPNPLTRDVSVDKNSGKNSSINIDNKSLKIKQTWGNVKKMRKEFSKLNKKNKSKLNISIEMCKKAQSAAKLKSVNSVMQLVDAEPLCVNIDENTPDAANANKTSQENSQNIDEGCIIVGESAKNLSVPKVNNLPKLELNNEVSNQTLNKLLNKELNVDIEPNNFETAQIISNNDKNDQLLKNTQIEVNNSTINKNVCKTQPMPFIKKSLLCTKNTIGNIDDKYVRVTQNEVESNTAATSKDDIEISIKIGSTITNIVIKNKKSDVQMKVNTDREVQTSLGPYRISNKTDAMCSPIKAHYVQNIELDIGEANKITVKKSLSTKKNTDSADTATIPFEITDSVEKELSNEMEFVGTKNDKNNAIKMTPKTSTTIVTNKHSLVKGPVVLDNEDEIHEEIDDVDIFNSGSVKSTSVKLLKDSKYAASEILPTIKSKKSQKVPDKRDRETSEDVDLPCSKKQRTKPNELIKHVEESTLVPLEPPSENVANDSENMNYDAIMSQVFANIDADIQNTDSKNSGKENTNLNKKTNDLSRITKQSEQQSQLIHKTQSLSRNAATITKVANTSEVFENIIQKYSENMFSLLEKGSEPHNVSGSNKNQLPTRSSTQQQIENLLTPGISKQIEATDQDTRGDDNIEMIAMQPDLGTPFNDQDDDSDKSVVEETPQKNPSFAKPKPTDSLKTASNSPLIIEDCSRKLQSDGNKHGDLDHKPSDSQVIKSIINISDTYEELSKTKDATVIQAMNKETLETPLNINKFVNHITYNSTPLARKSLNFENDNLEDPEQTLCRTTTQEKEFMAKAFEQTPKSPVRRPLTLKNMSMAVNKKLFVAGSCLTAAEVRNVMLVCQQRGWAYLDKYTDDLTHLVVGVDEENKSQRTIKYMRALAASKWIVTYGWVQKCLELKSSVVDELPYEALDATGEAGPRRARTATHKLFEGIRFFCMAPFSILDLDTLKAMLKTAGGCVVEDPIEITTSNCHTPGLLLAEPEHTQEDRFVYFAMEHKVVPVNYEWVLNCLGTYSLRSIQDLLLCPSSLLPPETSKWPAVLLMHDDYD